MGQNTSNGVTFVLKSDATGVKPGVDEAKASFDDLGRSAQAAGANASAALNQTSKSAEGSASSAKVASAAYGEQAQALAKLVGQIDPAAAALAKLDAQQQALGKFKASGVLRPDDFDALTAKINANRNALDADAISAAKAAKAADQQAAALASLRAKIDPAAGALEKLNVQQQALNKFFSSGAISGEEFVASTAKIAASRDALSGAASAAGKLATGSSAATREVGILSGELARGNYSRFEGSLITLANQTGFLTQLLTPFGAGIIAGAAALGVFAVAVVKGERETDAFNKAILLSGNYAGTTTQALVEQASAIGAATGKYGDAQQALTKLVAAGKLSGDTLNEAAKGAAAFSALSGESIEKAVEEFNKLAEEPVTASAKLNESLHYLTLSVYDQIKALKDHGDQEGATSLAVTSAATALETRRKQDVENAGYIERAWKAAHDAVTGYLDALGNVGKQTSPQQSQLDRLYAERYSFTDDNGNATPGSEDRVKQIDAQISALNDLKSATDAAAKAASDANIVQSKGIEAAAAVDKLTESIDKQSAKQKALNDLRANFNKLFEANVNGDDPRLAGVLRDDQGNFHGGLYDSLTADINKKYKPAVDHTADHNAQLLLEQNNAMQAQINLADSLAAKIGGPLDEAQQKYENSLTQADIAARNSLIAGNDFVAVLAQQQRAYDNAAKVRDETNAKIIAESDIYGVLKARLDGDAAARGKSTLALKAEQIVRELIAKTLKQTGIDYSAETDQLNEQAEARLRLGAIKDYAQNLNNENAALEAQIANGGPLSATQQAQLDLTTKLAGATGDQADAIKKAGDAAIDAAKKHDTLNASLEIQKSITDGLNELIAGTQSGVNGGSSFFEALGQSAARVLPNIAKQFNDIIEKQKEATGGSVDFGKALDGLGDTLEKTLPALGQLVGTIAGGGGTGAQTGSAVGSLIGGIIGTFAGGNTAIGAAIGGLLGGVIGGQGDGNGTPAIYGSSIPGSGGRDRTAPVSTPLGIFAADTDNLADDAYKNFEATVKGFDQQLAKLLDPAQLDAAKAALEGFSGKFSDINSLLQARFDVVLGTLDKQTQDFVNGFATDLQGRVQALADILAVGKNIVNGSGITGVNLDDTINLINEFSTAGERAIDTFTRLKVSAADFDLALQLTGNSFDGTATQMAEFAAKIADAAGSTDQLDALWQNFFTKFYGTTEQALANLSLLQDKAKTDLGNLGLSTNIDESGFRKAFEAALPTLTPEQVATWLEAAKALSDATDAQQAYNDALQKSQGDYVNFIAGLAGDSGKLSSFANSRLQIEQWERDTIKQANALAKAAGLQGASEQDLTLIHEVAAHKIADAIGELQSATQDLVDKLYHNGQSVTDSTNTATAAVGGFGNAMTSVAQAASAAAQLLLGDLSPLNDSQKLQYALQAFNNGAIAKTDVLDIAHRLYGSSQPYVDLFNSLANRPDRVGSGSGAGGFGGGSFSGSSSSSQESAAQRHDDANTIAQNIASLANVQKESYADVAKSLHLNLSDLAKDLNLSQDDLTKYLDNLTAQENSIPDSLDGNFDRLIAALYNIAGLPPPTGLNGDTTVNGLQHGRGGTATTFGANGDGSTVVIPTGHSGHALPILQSTSVGTDPESAAILRDVRTTLNAILAQARSGNNEVVEAVREVAEATDNVGQVIRSGANQTAAQQPRGRRP